MNQRTRPNRIFAWSNSPTYPTSHYNTDELLFAIERALACPSRTGQPCRRCKTAITDALTELQRKHACPPRTPTPLHRPPTDAPPPPSAPNPDQQTRLPPLPTGPIRPGKARPLPPEHYIQ